MARHLGKVIVIGISGTTNSGKSTIVEKLLQEVPNATVVHQDHYFLPPGDPRLEPVYIPELDHHNWEDYRTLEMDSMVDDVKKLISYHSQMPAVYPKFIFIDGYSIFGWRPLAGLFSLKYFLSVDKDTCAARRKTRNYNPPDKPGYFEKVVWPMHLKHLELIKDQSDIVYMETSKTVEEKVSQILADIDNLKLYDNIPQ